MTTVMFSSTEEVSCLPQAAFTAFPSGWGTSSSGRQELQFNPNSQQSHQSASREGHTTCWGDQPF